jgi:hypothetical protein
MKKVDVGRESARDLQQLACRARETCKAFESVRATLEN